MIISKKKNIEYGNFMCAMVILFTVYSIHIYESALPPYFTFRNVFMLLVIFRVLYQKGLKKAKLKKSDILFLTICIFECIYANLLPLIMGVNNSSNYNTGITSFNYLVLVAFFPLIFENTVKDTRQFTRCIAVISVIQAIIVIFSFSFPPVRSFLLTIQEIDPNSIEYISRSYDMRNFGLGLSGAGGSVTLFCGFLGAAYSWVFLGKKTLYILEMAIIAFGTVLIGRTGFYAEVILTCYMIFITNFQSIKGLFNTVKMLITFALVISAGIFALGIIQTLDENLTYITFYRVTEIFRSGMNNGTMGAINSFWGNLDVLTFRELLFGTGVSRGITANGIIVAYDCAYIQRLFAVGLIPALISYVNIAYYLGTKLKYLNRALRFFLLISILLMFGMEYKESIIYKLSYSLTLVMMCRLAIRDHERVKMRRTNYTHSN